MKKAIVLLVVAAAASACATLSPTYRLGNKAEIVRNWDEAIRLYEQAVISNPQEPVYRLSLMRAKLSASLDALKTAREMAAAGRLPDAEKAYKKALAYDPTNRTALMELKAMTAPPPTPAAAAEQAEREGPPRLKTSGEKLGLKFSDAASRAVFQALGKHAGVNFLFDESFRDAPVTIDLSDRTFDQALAYLCMASKNFHRVIDEKTVIVIPDNAMKRMQYEQNGIKTFYLSNLNAQDVQNSLAMMVRNTYKGPSIILDKTLNSVTIRDTPQAIELAGKLIKEWDRSPGEVMIDLEIMEVSRLRLKTLGLDLSNHSIGLGFNNPDAAGSDKGLYRVKGLGLGNLANYEVSLPTAYLDFLEKDVDTKIIAQPRLRGVGSEDIKYLVGQKVPIPQTQFQPIAAGGLNTQPLTSFQYQDVGIDVKIKPRIHYEGEVTLEMELKITSIGGSGVADIPILNTREVKNVIRLKDGETNLLAGLLRDEERRTNKGIAGLKHLPMLGALFSNDDKTIEQTDVILTVTPYIIRPVPGKESSPPIWIESEGASGGGGGEESGVEQEQIAPDENPEPVYPGAGDEESQANIINLSPGAFDVPVKGEVRVSVDVISQAKIGALSMNLQFDPRVLKLKDVQPGNVASGAGGKAPFLKSFDNASGLCTIGANGPPGQALSPGTLAVLVFEAVAAGESSVSVISSQANASNGTSVTFTSREARITVH